ncbi:MAG: nodulation protein NfeD [Anaerolineae bacterium]|nr:nodulation protein NfeD [Anaerolineae bacterium]
MGCLLGPSARGEASRPVVVLKVRGIIDPIVARYIVRGLATATQEDASLVVLRLDTPGGLDTAMREIVQALLNAQVPTAVFVSPSGARAASAGVFITMAAHIAAMAPGTNIGAATPIGFGGEEPPKALESKAVNDAAAYIRAIAHQRGRNGEWAAKAVRESISLPAHEALEENVIDLLADDLDDLLRQLDGRQVEVAGQRVTLHLRGAPVRRFPMTWLEVIAHGILDPNIAYILLSLGTLALLAEFYHPGAILPGVTGVISLLLAFVALGTLPVNWGGIALIIVAFIFFIADVKVPGFALSVAGAISFVLGSLLLFSPLRPAAPTMPRLRVSPWVVIMMTGLVVGFFGLVVTAAIRAQKRVALMGPQRLVGKVGVAVTDLAPEGIVRVESETWSASVEGPEVRAGEKVQVLAVEGLRLRVRKME